MRALILAVTLRGIYYYFGVLQAKVNGHRAERQPMRYTRLVLTLTCTHTAT